MRRMTPGLNIAVPNTLQDDGTDIQVNLKFESMDDFLPASVVEQVPALKALLDARNELRDLLSKADRSEDLERLLEDILQNKTDLGKLVSELKEKNSAGT
jgi:type VI secretion system protein ImpB